MELSRVKVHTGVVHIALVDGDQDVDLPCGSCPIHGVSNKCRAAITTAPATCAKGRHRYRREHLDDPQPRP